MDKFIIYRDNNSNVAVDVKIENETIWLTQKQIAELFDEYMNRYSRVMKKSWVYDEREVPKFLSSWYKRKISSITNQEVRRLHELVRSNNGLYQANRLLERVKAAKEWGYAKSNPADHIKKYKEKKRERFLMPNEIPAFFKSLDLEENLVAKNYFKILLFTGARKTNVLEMRWSEIDFIRF